MTNFETYNTLNVGIKQDIINIKNDFPKSLENLKFGISDKFKNINGQLVTFNSNFQENLKHLIAESFSNIKDFIIEALHEKNSKLHQAIEKLESQVSVLKTDHNNLDQNNKSKKLDIHGIPDSVSYQKLEEKVTENLDQIDFRIITNNIDNCRDIG